MPSNRLFLVLTFGLLVCGLMFIPAPVEAQDRPNISHVLPNPVTPENEGEFIAISGNGETNLSGWFLTDGHHSIPVPVQHVNGTTAISAAPRTTALLTPIRPIKRSDHLPLAANGDSIELRDANGSLVDRFAYPETDTSEQWLRIHDGIEPQGGTESLDSFPTRTIETTRPFVLPDAGDKAIDLITEAEEQILLAGYELTDPAVVAALVKQYRNGVDVRVLLDGTPVGGQHADEVAGLNVLGAAGIPVRILDGSRDRFRYHHPKYLVTDRTAMVSTENWKRAGLGGHSSRGWGVVVSNSTVRADLRTVFAHDFSARDSLNWVSVDSRDGFDQDSAPTRDFPTKHPPESIETDRAQILTAPEAAEPVLRTVIGNASESIRVQQVRIGDPSFPLLRELIAAAERGVEVRIQLDHSWYVADENEALVEQLSEHADRAELPLSIRLVEPADRFEKIHTKGMVIDDELVVVGSMNWNNVSMRDNREVLLVLEGTDAGSYFTTVFESDWEPPRWLVPIGYPVVTVLIWIGMGLLGRREISFDSTASSSDYSESPGSE